MSLFHLKANTMYQRQNGREEKSLSEWDLQGKNLNISRLTFR